MTRRIVITGGGTGIGLASARRLLEPGASLVLVGRRREVLEAAAQELSASQPDAVVTCVAADLADPNEVAALAEELHAGATVDVLVMSAGGNAGGPRDSSPAEVARAWRADFESNVLSTVMLFEAVKDHLTRPGARIVAVSSLAGLRGSGAYGGAKAAVNAWMWSAATEMAPHGVTVNSVAPGFVPETPFWAEKVAADPDVAAKRIAPIPMQRPGTADEVAAAIEYLCSPDAGWTTGQILQVNGGTLLGHG